MRAWKEASGARFRPDVSRLRRSERTRHRDLHVVRQPARARRGTGRRGPAARIAGSAETGTAASAPTAAAETAATAAAAGEHRPRREKLSGAAARVRGADRRRLRRDRVHRRDHRRVRDVVADPAPARAHDAAPSAPMRLRSAVAMVGLALGCAAPALAQSPPPAPAATAVPWHPRPVIIIDPNRYLASPSPRPHAKHRATPRPHASRRPLHRPTPGPEVFERHDTAPPPTTPPRAL